MTNAVVTGTTDLGSLEIKSSSGGQHFADKMEGNLHVNGVRVMLHSHTVDHLIKTINRFTPQTNVTAAVASSAGKHLTLTSPESMHLEGDVMKVLGLPSGVIHVSTGATAVSSH